MQGEILTVPHHAALEDEMSVAEMERRMDELDRLLNDPETPMNAERVWAILAEISRTATPAPRRLAPRNAV